MTCQQFDRIEADYLSGTLSETDARALEAHAASCASCEARLDAKTRRDVTAFAPTLPPELRTRTLAAVRARRSAGRRARRWWTAGIAAAAAAVVLSVGVARFTSAPADDPTTTVATQDTAVSPAATLAMLSSRDEFAALDEAIRELETALAASPGDAELQAFLASAIARRTELERQVKDAA